MRFKIDTDLKMVADAFREKTAIPVSDEQFAKDLCTLYVNAGLLEDTPDSYGLPVTQAMPEAHVSTVAAMLSAYLDLAPIPANVFDSFTRLIVMGDGDCPHCGGNLKYKETVGHELKDGDYWTPNSWVADYYVYTCPICGETIKTPNEL